MRRAGRESFEQMLKSDQKMRVFNETVPAGILILGVDDGRVVFANSFFEDHLGTDGSDLLGKSWERFFMDPDQRENFMVEFVEKNSVRNFELRLKGKENKEVWGLSSLSSVAIEDEDLLLFAFVDISELKAAEAQIRQLANYDTLTELPTRHLINDRLETAISRARRNKTEFALLFVDLDEFKGVNDNLGHDAGDEVLIEVAKRLQRSFRGPDTIGRLGGDEFVVIVENQNEQGVSIVGNRIVESLRRPIQTESGEASIGASVGVGIYPRDGETATDLLKSADRAMYQVKKTGKGALAFA
jgi:diguanylate cyclase (GGDEF)-like protein/PAS domain S-box-containing protein